ncbi:MAG TPA: rod shape-determining protein MreD [Bryobacteraceae bacterium]|nr:rod shape-determining protein MreD [Bryobacteraceae bacterium]
MNDIDWTLTASARGHKKIARIRPWVMLAAPVAAILFQVYTPIYFPLLQYLELPLLVTIYLSISRRSPLGGALIGAVIGLVQDALSHQPIGVLGMVKTITGYASAALGVRLDTGHVVVRLVLIPVMFVTHQLLYWMARRFLLGAPSGATFGPTLLAMLANAVLGILLFHLLDKLRDSGQ